MSELKPCPFCGEKATMCQWGIGKDYFVSCTLCGVGILEEDLTEIEATEMWNTRAIDPRILLFIRQMKLLSSAYHGRPNGANDCLCEFELLFPELKEAKDE